MGARGSCQALSDVIRAVVKSDRPTPRSQTGVSVQGLWQAPVTWPLPVPILGSHTEHLDTAASRLRLVVRYDGQRLPLTA